MVLDHNPEPVDCLRDFPEINHPPVRVPFLMLRLRYGSLYPFGLNLRVSAGVVLRGRVRNHPPGIFAPFGPVLS